MFLLHEEQAYATQMHEVAWDYQTMTPTLNRGYENAVTCFT
jgi:hypothetical protein